MPGLSRPGWRPLSIAELHNHKIDRSPYHTAMADFTGGALGGHAVGGTHQNRRASQSRKLRRFANAAYPGDLSTSSSVASMMHLLKVERSQQKAS
eukprot:1137442-Pelagomonas_calceolata.AAC.10